MNCQETFPINSWEVNFPPIFNGQTNLAPMFQHPMNPDQGVLYIKKNQPHRSITTLKYIKIRQPRPEIEGVSKLSLTVKHPVVAPGGNSINFKILEPKLRPNSGPLFWPTVWLYELLTCTTFCQKLSLPSGQKKVYRVAAQLSSWESETSYSSINKM